MAIMSGHTKVSRPLTQDRNKKRNRKKLVEMSTGKTFCQHEWWPVKPPTRFRIRIDYDF